MATIQLTQGYHTIIDDEDVDKVSQYKWHTVFSRGKAYAATNIPTATGQKILKLHHFLTGGQKWIDHHNGDSLDNRKENLRPCSPKQNSQNQKLRKDSTTGYKGVTKHYNKFRAQIFVEGKKKYLGLFATAELAAHAYNAAAREYFGDFALLNNIEGK